VDFKRPTDYSAVVNWSKSFLAKIFSGFAVS
jgi:hypothetical protein